MPGVDVVAQQNIWLDLEQRVEGVPDVVIKVDDRPALVLDTKYKPYLTKPSNDDLNQMIVYCHRLGLERGILVYPGRVPSDRFVFQDIVVEVRSLDLTGDLRTFRSRCQTFARDLHRMVAAGRLQTRVVLPRGPDGHSVPASLHYSTMKLPVHAGLSGFGSIACHASSVRRSLMGCLNS